MKEGGSNVYSEHMCISLFSHVSTNTHVYNTMTDSIGSHNTFKADSVDYYILYLHFMYVIGYKYHL